MLAVVYVMFNEGFVSSTGATQDRDLAADAVWLAGVIATAVPQEPEAWGLAALSPSSTRAARRVSTSTAGWCCSATRTAPGGTPTRSQRARACSNARARCGTPVLTSSRHDALVPALKKAMDRGITVISWDLGVAPEGRQMHLNPSDTNLIGETIIKLAADYLPEGGDVAILSASSTATNQNAWIEAAKKALPEKFPKINLVTTVYGDDDLAKSTDEAKGLLKTYPNLKAIIAPTTVGVVAAAQVVTDENLIGKVNVTGLALPSEFKKFIDNGASQAVALWNPIDLGYSAVYLAHDIATKKAEAKPGAKLSIGRVGEVTLDDTNSAAMAAPFKFDKSNIEEFSKILLIWSVSRKSA